MYGARTALQRALPNGYLPYVGPWDFVRVDFPKFKYIVAYNIEY